MPIFAAIFEKEIEEYERILREQGMAMIPVGRSLFEYTEMADHFRAFDYMVSHLDHPFDETLLKDL